jgi:inosine-uridine nucleoside N-ribohydrolase
LDIPIYQGFSSNKTSDNYFGPYGFGNIDESMITDDDYKNVHTSEKELDNFVKKYRNSIYVCTAPKTTIAKYLNYFDCIYSMGGTIYATGNVYEPSTGTYFEFNQ